jgi:alpha-glucosidase
MYKGKNSIVRKWISPQFGMSGWRIDVGNMTGRLGADDLHDDVMRGIRQAMDETNPDAWLVAENGDFVASDLNGLGWHGAMNYQGFMRPVWNWLNRNSEIGGGFGTATNQQHEAVQCIRSLEKCYRKYGAAR